MSIIKKDILGVVGGMGPFASAEFLRTIYENYLDEQEQNLPVVLMYSDPTFPDRTEAFLAGVYEPLLDQLITALSQLKEWGASRTVICCITIHHLLPLVPEELRDTVVSLIDVALSAVERSPKRHLLVCTSGTRRMEIFQTHCRWEKVKDLIVLPEPGDQDQIHDLIYSIKKNHDPKSFIPIMESLLSKYEVDSFIAGCTEMHILAKRFISSNGNEKRYGCVDALSIIAKGMAEKSHEEKVYTRAL